MFSNLNFWEVGAMVLLALFIFGPERLPKVLGDGMRMLRNLRNMARNATDDLSKELGHEVRLEDLHPKTFIRKHLISEDEERELRRPFEEAYQDVKSVATDANDYARGGRGGFAPVPTDPPASSSGSSAPAPRYGETPGQEQPRHAAADDKTDTRRYDADAT